MRKLLILVLGFCTSLVTMCTPDLDEDRSLIVQEGLYRGGITLHDNSGDTAKSYSNFESELRLSGQHYRITEMFCCVENVSEGLFSFSDKVITFSDTMTHEPFIMSHCLPLGQCEYFYDGNELQMTQVRRETGVYFDLFFYRVE